MFKVIKKEGKDRFQNLIDNSENITSYKIRKLRENYNLDNPDDKVEFVEKAAVIFSEMKNSVEQEIFVKKIAEELEDAFRKIIIERQMKYAPVLKIGDIDYCKDICRKPIHKARSCC